MRRFGELLCEHRRSFSELRDYRSFADFPNGLVMVPKVMSLDPARGLIFEYAAMGLPVINLNRY